MADVISKQQLLAALKDGEREALATLAAIPAEKFQDGCYENGWNAGQVLAHITAIEWTYPKLIDVARTPPAPKVEAGGDAAPPQRKATGGINDYNERSIARYSDASVEELIEAFKTNRAKTIEVIEATEPELFEVHVKSAGGIPGPLGTVLNYVAVMHVNGHIKDIAGAAGLS